MRIINKLIYALNIVILASCSLVPPAETGDVSMSFSEEIHEIFVGESFQFEVVLLPDNRHADAIWHSSNTTFSSHHSYSLSTAVPKEIQLMSCDPQTTVLSLFVPLEPLFGFLFLVPGLPLE